MDDTPVGAQTPPSTGSGTADDALLPWEPQPWDTAASYKAFKDFYLREEPGNGRLIRAYRAYGRAMGSKGAAKKVPGTWNAWANGRHPTSGQRLPGARTWAERAAAYDAHVAAEELKELAKQRVASKKSRIRAAEGALAHLTIMLSQYDFRPKMVNGRIERPGLPDFKDAVRAMATIFNELRVDFDDLPTQRLQHVGDADKPVVHKFDLSNVPFEVLAGLAMRDEGPPPTPDDPGES